MNEQSRIFSQNLKRLMSEKNVAQAEAAKAIGVSPQTFNTWMQGKAIPRHDKLQRLATFFDVYKSELLEPIENQRSARRMEMYAALLSKLEQLDDSDCIRIEERINTLLESDKYKEV